MTEAVEPEWLHQVESDFSPITGAVAACRTCGWGEAFEHANTAKAAAEAHRDEFGKAVVVDE